MHDWLSRRPGLDCSLSKLASHLVNQFQKFDQFFLDYISDPKALTLHLGCIFVEGTDPVHLLSI